MKNPQQGWTLVEALISLAVTVVALGAAVPGFDEARARRHVDGAAAQLGTDLQMARSLAVLQNRTLRVSFRADDAGSCYVIHSGTAGSCQCDARGVSTCTGGAEALRGAGYGTSVRLTSNSPSMVFDPVRGTVTPTGTVVVSSGEQSVRVITNVMGRVRACSPLSASAGYPRC